MNAKLAEVAALAHPDDFLSQLPAAILIVAEGGEIAFANTLACSLFAPVNPVGLGLRTLFALAGTSGASALIAALDGGRAGAAVRATLADGRVLECRSGPSAQGGSSIVLLDVSDFVRDAQLAAHDPLTGLTNRASLNDRLGVLLARETLLDAPVAVLCVDLDRFKAVNDTLGHPIGDALLKKVAERLRTAAGDGNVVARLGGDEFAIVQIDAEQPQGAEALAARIVDLIGRTYIIAGHMVNIGASVGVALAPSDGSDADTLLKRADLALYCAKGDGRGVFRRFASEMDAGMNARRLLELDLRRALALKQFELVYQPQVQLEGGTIVGFEALLRWRSPARGLVPPAGFIPLAEEIGLIVPIGEWVLRTACHEAASWPKHVSIAVNLSPVQFRSGRLVKTVVSALAASGIDPTRLELEITEGALLENTEAVLQSLRALRTLGVRISMDDFGTGYSSLSYLQKFPFDKIKIDQSFIRGMEDNPDCGAIVRAVVGLGASLGMKTTAEGVETAEQLARIRAEGCNEVQGYLTGRPVSPQDAAALLAASSSTL
jgi:diguanylate cyclase (GGDEF)-like protein